MFWRPPRAGMHHIGPFTPAPPPAVGRCRRRMPALHTRTFRQNKLRAVPRAPPAPRIRANPVACHSTRIFAPCCGSTCGAASAVPSNRIALGAPTCAVAAPTPLTRPPTFMRRAVTSACIISTVHLDVPTTFVLGAGFSAEDQFPLVRGLRERVIHFLEAERHSRYVTFLEPDEWFPQGQFYEGLANIDPAASLGFEELLIAAQTYLKTASKEDPAHVTDDVLRIGVARLLWCITFFIWRVGGCYQNFAARFRENKEQWRVVSFNWDILVERSLSEADVHWSYSSATQGIPVIKPHGSINWSSFAQNKNLSNSYSGWAPTAPGSTLSFDATDPLKNPDLQEINSDLRYCLFPGDPDLPQTHSDLDLLWSDVEAVIARSDRIVFMGYSLPAYDTFAAQQLAHLCASKEVIVYDPSEEALKRFVTTLPTAYPEKLFFRSTPYASRSAG